MTDKKTTVLRDDISYNPDRRHPDYVPRHAEPNVTLKPADDEVATDGTRVWAVTHPNNSIQHEIVLGDDDARYYAKAMGIAFDEPQTAIEDEDKDAEAEAQVE